MAILVCIMLLTKRSNMSRFRHQRRYAQRNAKCLY